ncbi:hypothetical protein F2Q70_00044499 [Brassica cretica]|uniref:Uncharacterized protein n=1 Tax=Brassica cretica TaxID=69181 RepID=A0A8S9KD10_BRACR|nr:hypothetical protein F2Q70_00044499 [Brassica cretica]
MFDSFHPLRRCSPPDSSMQSEQSREERTMMMKRVSSDNCGYVGAAWETVNESKETVNESVEDKGLAGSIKIQRSHKDVKPSIFKFIRRYIDEHLHEQIPYSH